jgi:hypothetical protein
MRRRCARRRALVVSAVIFDDTAVSGRLAFQQSTIRLKCGRWKSSGRGSGLRAEASLQRAPLAVLRVQARSVASTSRKAFQSLVVAAIYLECLPFV